MLITFKSHASGDVIMLENNGKDLLSLLGKDPTEAKGIVTCEQLPDAIAAIRKAIGADKTRHPDPVDTGIETDGTPDDGIRLFQRALPLLELLERSSKDGVPVTWGV